MTGEQLGWTIGIIDEEGSILLNGKRGVKAPRITVPSTDIEVLDELKALWGGFITPRKDKRKQTLRAWMWVLSTNQALTLLRDGVSFMRVPLKKDRAEYLLKGWRTGRTRKERQAFEDGFYALEDGRRRRGEAATP